LEKRGWAVDFDRNLSLSYNASGQTGIGDLMEEETLVEEDTSAPALTAGERLQAARRAKGIELSQVAAETRIPQRHLVAIENSDYSQLPSRTYAIGFTRTYARVLDLDERDLLDQLRTELGEDQDRHNMAPARFEPGDPARVPSRKLAWFGALAAVLLLVGGFVFYRTYFAPGLGPAPLQEEREPAIAQVERAPGSVASHAVDPDAEVVFTSEMNDTWVKFYDESGERLYEAQMAQGESFTVPADAEGPQVWTGRPYALAITIDGRPVPKLSEEDEIVRDVPVTAEALMARNEPSKAPGSDPSETDVTVN
jgi:cytoskeleton protein RodZ